MVVIHLMAQVVEVVQQKQVLRLYQVNQEEVEQEQQQVLQEVQ